MKKNYTEIFKDWLQEDKSMILDEEIELAQDFCTYLDNHFNDELNELIEKISQTKEEKSKIHEMASCMLSILDYLKLQDKCKEGEPDMTELNDETLSEMMFRKMKAHNIDLNKELGFTHLKPISKKNKK